MRGKFDFISAGVTLLLHALLILLLWLSVFELPKPEEEGGVSVIMGSMGNLDTDYDLTEVASITPVPRTVTPVPTPNVADPLITQTLEETVALPDGEDKPVVRREEQRTPTPEELRAQREQQASEESRQLMDGLFSDTQGETDRAVASAFDQTGTPGVPESDQTQGAAVSSGGWGSFDLSGRSVGSGGLKRPAYTVQEEGRVVVTITVDPSGNVVATSINKRTNTVNPELRKAAEEAARATKFNAVAGPNNQTGTITYYFTLN